MVPLRYFGGAGSEAPSTARPPDCAPTQLLFRKRSRPMLRLCWTTKKAGGRREDPNGTGATAPSRGWKSEAAEHLAPPRQRCYRGAPAGGAVPTTRGRPVRQDFESRISRIALRSARTAGTGDRDSGRMAAFAAGTSRAAHGDAQQRRQRAAAGHLSTAYLLMYNVAMTAGWLVITVLLVREYLAKGSHRALYYSIEKPLKLFQTGAVLEFTACISLPGIVPSSVVLTGFQVTSRVFLTWAVTHSVREVQHEDSVLLFVVAWTLTEIIRYSFYTFSLLNHVPYFIKWARYTFFMVLYPMGVTGELLTILAALPHVRKTGLYSLALPNVYNFSFDYHTFLILTMISYIPLFPQLYFHMLQQRRKVLGATGGYSKVE
ncbi:very-long-chain (3R)-3-hydroxyacyl-CoA dehydratase 2 [Arapaima gigas]